MEFNIGSTKWAFDMKAIIEWAKNLWLNLSGKKKWKKLRNTRLLSEERKLSDYAWNLRSTFADYTNLYRISIL